MSNASLAPCEMCQNGLADHQPTIDGDRVALCGACYGLLAADGRVDASEEVTA